MSKSAAPTISTVAIAVSGEARCPCLASVPSSSAAAPPSTPASDQRRRRIVCFLDIGNLVSSYQPTCKSTGSDPGCPRLRRVTGLLVGVLLGVGYGVRRFLLRRRR